MSIVKTITNDYAFAEWVKNSDSYSDNFTFEGANALQAYFEEYSEELLEGTIEFDPIAWCSEFTEYQTLNEAWEIYREDDPTDITNAEKLEFFRDNTTVIEFDGGIIVQDF